MRSKRYSKAEVYEHMAVAFGLGMLVIGLVWMCVHAYGVDKLAV